MSGKIWFDQTSDKLVLSDGEHYIEVPHWAREIIGNEFERVERETRHLETENAKLREQVARLFDKTLELGAENAKLRELVDILCFCMQIHKRCDDCKLNGAKGELGLGHDPLLACDGLHEMLKELGIEV